MCTILLNVSLAKKADKLYPLLQEKNDNKLSKEEIHSIFKNVKALFVYKFGAVILDGTDSIIISAIINITTVGISSNYTLLINSVSNIVSISFSSSSLRTKVDIIELCRKHLPFLFVFFIIS